MNGVLLLPLNTEAPEQWEEHNILSLIWDWVQRPKIQDSVNLCQRRWRRFCIAPSIGRVISGTLCVRISSHSYCNVCSRDFAGARLALAFHNCGREWNKNNCRRYTTSNWGLEGIIVQLREWNNTPTLPQKKKQVFFQHLVLKSRCFLPPLWPREASPSWPDLRHLWKLKVQFLNLKLICYWSHSGAEVVSPVPRFELRLSGCCFLLYWSSRTKEEKYLENCRWK